MSKTCNNCLHWRLNIQPAAYQGTCMHFQDSNGKHSQMRANDFCSRHIEVEACCKESTNAASVLMSLLIKQVTELQSKVQDLSLKMDIMNARLDNHVDDRDRHLRQPGKYTAHNLFM